MDDGGINPGYSSVHKYGGRREGPWIFLCTEVWRMQEEPWKDLSTEMYYLSMP
jgi:hypothetical protein